MKKPTLPAFSKLKLRLPRLVMPSWRQVVVSRYLWTALVAAVWLIFFDNYSFFRQRQMAENIQTLRQDKRYYEIETQKVDYQANLIFNDEDELERFARERFYMHKPNEDVFIVTDKPEQQLPKPQVKVSVGTFKKPAEGLPKPFETNDTVQHQQGNPRAPLGDDQ